MARVEYYRYTPHRIEVIDGKVVAKPKKHRRAIERMPWIVWDDHTPWMEANVWAVERATSRDVDMQTVTSNLRALQHYATFLESESLQWFQFPQKKQDRCLVRYRGFLVDERDNGRLSPSTASARMRAVIQFYRWARSMRLLPSEAPLWVDRTAYVNFFDSVGFERTLVRVTTDLAIPNRTRPGERLEDGLLPVTAKDRDAICDFAKEHASEELWLMLLCGFYTGMRIGTLCDLRVPTLLQAVADPTTPELFRLSVGPGASPPVHTKGGVTGQVMIPKGLLDLLLEYAHSTRRLLRAGAAEPAKKDLLFLTRHGNSYQPRGAGRSSPVNVEMLRLRRAGAANGIDALKNFHFHQSRATFGTELARLGIANGNPVNAIALVRDALLHKSEATSFRYIKFIRNEPTKRDAANAFTAWFLGTNKQEGSSNV